MAHEGLCTAAPREAQGEDNALDGTLRDDRQRLALGEAEIVEIQVVFGDDDGDCLIA